MTEDAAGEMASAADRETEESENEIVRASSKKA